MGFFKKSPEQRPLKKKEMRGLPRERFRIEVDDNFAVAGMGVTQYLRYRWRIIDTERPEYGPVKTDYQISTKVAYKKANNWLSRAIRS